MKSKENVNSTGVSPESHRELGIGNGIQLGCWDHSSIPDHTPLPGNEKFVKRVRCGGIFNIQPELEFARIQDRFGIYRRCLALLAFHFVR